MKNTIVGVDLAKKVIHVCVVHRNQLVSNDEMSPAQFTSWLAMAKPATIVFESCATSNYWKQVAQQKGHDVRIISAKFVSQIRQNQKPIKMMPSPLCKLANLLISSSSMVRLLNNKSCNLS